MSERYPGGYITKTPPAPTETSAQGVWTLEQALQNVKAGTWPPNGPFYIEEVFSTYLYTGNGSTQTITNDINLSGKGGLVWTKCRSTLQGHRLVDTVRGATKSIASNTTAGQATESTGLTSFNSSGYALGADADYNTNAATYVSWSFRKQPKFFDIVTYTGDGTSNRLINHSLGSAPGCVIIKCTNTSAVWPVWHRSLAGTDYNMYLNTTAESAANADFSSNGVAQFTSTTFPVNSAGNSNTNGNTYVAYLFAHDAGGFGLTGSDNVITCGSYTGNGSSTGPSVSLGYEPQWLMIKNSSDNYFGSADWVIFDIMRGIPVSGDDSGLSANTDVGDSNYTNFLNVNATGFNITTANAFINQSSNTYIYIAIRRGPMKTPTTGTSVYNALTYTGNNTNPRLLDFSLNLDASFFHKRNSNVDAENVSGARLIGDPVLYTNSTASQVSLILASNAWASNTGVSVRDDGKINGSSYTYVGWGLRRAPGFFDVVCYTGTGSSTAISHNLTVTPELIILKKRNTDDATVGTNWGVWASAIGSGNLFLNATNSYSTSFLNLSATSTTFQDNLIDQYWNQSSNTYVAYLFASVPGVSKVGSYTGTGTTQQINCGFTGGARFVMIKRTDSTGGWYVWDSARGIVAGNDPYLLINNTDAEVTNTDYVDTYSLGFEISSTAPAEINANGGTFIFLAIA